MKKILFISVVILFSLNTFGQFEEAEERLHGHNTDTIMGWNFEGKFTLDISQAGFTNWAAGGDNSMSGIGNLIMLLKYIQEDFHWENFVTVGYGTQRLKKEFSKTDDKLRFISKIGKKAKKSWYYTALLDFRTQMLPGYDTDDSSLKISNWMSPAYLFLSAGMDFKPDENLSVFLSPATYKATIVLDQQLADSGSFGLDPGHKLRNEFGAYIMFFYKHELFKNVTFMTNLNLYSNYLYKPQNIDIDWRVELDLKVNKFIRASIKTHLIYDDDILIKYDSNGDGDKDSEGPRVQFKEIIAVGLAFEF